LEADFHLISRLRRFPLSSAGHCHRRRKVFFSLLDVISCVSLKSFTRLLGRAAELVGLNVDVIVTHANGIFAAQRATTTIPIVQAVGPDLVALGIVASLAHPGGNITGSTFFVSELMAKRLELVKEVLPSMTRAFACFEAVQ
jgi:ABC-type uncharacterized transport system substrate-binding protein